MRSKVLALVFNILLHTATGIRSNYMIACPLRIERAIMRSRYCVTWFWPTTSGQSLLITSANMQVKTPQSKPGRAQRNETKDKKLVKRETKWLIVLSLKDWWLVLFILWILNLEEQQRRGTRIHTVLRGTLIISHNNTRHEMKMKMKMTDDWWPGLFKRGVRHFPRF
jgi:hypothetical protein